MEQSYHTFVSLGFAPPPSPSRATGSFTSEVSVSSTRRISFTHVAVPEQEHDFALNLTPADEDKMMTHILDCLAALGHVQRRRRSQGEVDVAEDEVLAARDRVFQSAASSMVAALAPGDGDNGGDVDGGNVGNLMRAFPDNNKQVISYAKNSPTWLIASPRQ